MPKLTPEEITILLDALKVWEAAPQTNGFMVDVMMTVMCGKDEEQADRQTRTKRAQEAATRDCAIRREQSIVLQAKLIQSKHELLGIS